MKTKTLLLSAFFSAACSVAGFSQIFTPSGAIQGATTGTLSTTAVGIGTNNPGTPLTVRGGYSQYGGTLTGNTYDKFVLYCDNTNGLSFDAPRLTNWSGAAKLPISFQWRGDATPALQIAASGNVSIGKANALGKLDVYKGDIYLSGDPGTAPNGFVLHHQHWLNNGSLFIIPASNTTGAHVGSGWEFTADGEFKSYGKIWAPEIEVKLAPFPDYVFEDNYELKSLNEVETFIKTNKHLPGIPSANEIEKNGIGVGALQVKLMEKVEELTLYVLQLNAKNEQLQKEVEQIKHAGQK